jgi:hypothetical protein
MEGVMARFAGVGLLRAALIVGSIPVVAGVLGAPALGEAAPTKTFENAEFRYSVALPVGCRHEEGPGTLDAVCSPELDAEKSLEAAATASLLLEVGVEPAPQDAGKAAADLAQGYDAASFKDELPEAVCGETDKARVRIDNIKQVLEEARVIYTANVACPEIKFLGLGERDGIAEFLIMPGLRYRLVARAPKDDFEQNKASIDAFFASFKTLPAETRNQ